MTSSPEFDSLFPAVPFSRRNFIVTALGAGFALAVQPVMAQTTINTDSAGLLAGEIKVPAAGGEMPAYRAQPASGKNFPVILVVQEIFGVHEHIKDVCRRLAKQGYLAIAPELYARQGDPRQYSNTQELISNLVSKVADVQVMADLDACVAWAKINGGDTLRLGITGFCWGGVVRASGQPGKRNDAAPSGRRGKPPERAGARALWRAGSGDSARQRRAHAAAIDDR